MRFMPSRHDRKVFGKIAEEYDLVYFGTVDPRVDHDYVAVRGLTAQPNQIEENYTTGNVYDYEVAFLQRSRNAKLPNGVNEKKHWTILQVQLRSGGWPRIFIDGRSRAEEYGALVASYLRLSEIGWQNLANSAVTNFPQTFATYARLEDVGLVQKVLSSDVQAMLATHFTAFDYELVEDKLIIYATNTEINLEILDHMLRVGLWFARHIDALLYENINVTE